MSCECVVSVCVCVAALADSRVSVFAVTVLLNKVPGVTLAQHGD